jgi:SAM-dependent methyltransferase
MDASDRRRMFVNRRKWDESVPLHVTAPSYDVPAFLRGRSTLQPVEEKEMGSVRGKSLLHLQCHFGLDTLSWARRGATVTGVDFSLPAVRAARRIARRIGIPARFVHSNAYDLPDVLTERFDIVYTGKGAMCWLPDVDRWSGVVAQFLKPGGRFYLLEDHPVSEIFPNDPPVTTLEPKELYFGSRAHREEYDGTYASRSRMKHKVSYSWIHPVSETLSALLRQGLEITSVREFPYTYWRRYPFMREDRHGYWHLTRQAGVIPLMWSVMARTRSPSRS